jgi:hypothetical protein
MRTINNILICTITFFLFFFFNEKIYSQDNIKECKSYESLYNTIKSGQSASIKRTAYINEFSLIEKSILTIVPITSPDSGYQVTYKITDLEKGKRKSNYEDGSVLGFMVADCKSFEKKYEKFIGTSCWLFTDNPEDARDAAESGISYSIDQKYVIEGDLVTLYIKICRQDDHKPQPVKKPAVYLYPLEDMNIKVNVEVNGQLTLAEPLYNNGWDVNVSPDGLIDNKYDYLFYEANLNKIELPEEGWIVEYKGLEKWFDKYLPELGLNTKEIGQFKEYWLRDLRKANYYEIKLLDSKFLEENMKLIISPEPQTLIRLNFYFKPLFEKKEIKNPVICTSERSGFTVVEWGGINAAEIKIVP